MSVTSALYAGASGIAGMSKAMQVISNNLANIQTTGFKGSRAEFVDVLSQAINTPGGKKQIGRGVRVGAIQGLFHQGSFESTPVVTDVAINGSGWFQVTHNEEVFYTRDGSFRIDKDGILTNSVGMPVSGYLYDASGIATGEVGNINLSAQTASPNPTGDGVADGTGVFLNANLGATSEVNPGGAGFDPTDAQGTSNFSTSYTVYDSLGVPHTVLNYFNRTAEAGNPATQTTNDWEWHAVVDGAELNGGTAGTLTEIGTGTLIFDTNGQLAAGSGVGTLTADFAGGADPNQQIGLDMTGSTQVGVDPSVVNALTQDGYSAGTLQSIDINQDGIIMGSFSNGVARDVAQFVVAGFPAEHEMFRVGDNLWVETVAAGQPVLGTAGGGTNGTIAAGTLELSNVDMSEQFIKMITTQRSYQANTKVISTGDQMLETVINMKR